MQIFVWLCIFWKEKNIAFIRSLKLSKTSRRLRSISGGISGRPVAGALPSSRVYRFDAQGAGTCLMAKNWDAEPKQYYNKSSRDRRAPNGLNPVLLVFLNWHLGSVWKWEKKVRRLHRSLRGSFSGRNEKRLIHRVRVEKRMIRLGTLMFGDLGAGDLRRVVGLCQITMGKIDGFLSV